MLEEITKDSIGDLLPFFNDNNLPIVNYVELESNPFLNIVVCPFRKQVILKSFYNLFLHN